MHNADEWGIVLKQTRQKEAILNKVRNLHTHPSADEIFQSLKDDGEKIGLATVYRNLERFVQKGEIKKVEVFDKSDRFDFRVDEHQHLFCEHCGCVCDVDVDVNFELKSDSLKINGYKMLFYGICNKCKSEPATL